MLCPNLLSIVVSLCPMSCRVMFMSIFPRYLDFNKSIENEKFRQFLRIPIFL